MEKAKFVVGVGASAGGLEALELFFDHMPTDSGGAYVVVMHLSRDFKSMLDELLARHTGMPVVAATNGTELEANTVYVIQPRTTVEVDGLRLNVSTRPDTNPTGAATSVDTLFNSIALFWKAKGGAVVLSGSGSDGTKGIKSVSDSGGFTCAQSPETAKFDSMPLSAIATDCVKAVEAPEQLGQTVIDGILLPAITQDTRIVSDHDMAMKKIVDAVVGASSLDARQYKHSTFERRVRRRMMDLRINSLVDYADTIAEDDEEAENLSQALLIGVTEFFRDDKPFKVMRQQIVPEIIKNAQNEDRPIRIWIPGCATGEEPYSIAMLFSEALRDMPYKIEVQIFATDISRKHLNEAGRGEYSTDRIKNVPLLMREQFFSQNKADGIWSVNTELRKMIVFAPHNLLSDPPFTKLDLISCRNLLIYFSIEAQQKILGSFAFGLRERSFLFLGSSETVGGQREAFDFIDARNRVFRRTASRANTSSLARTRELYPMNAGSTAKTKRSAKVRETELQPAYAAMLKDYAPASMLVSSERQLLHSFGDTKQYIRPPEGVAHLDVTEMVDTSLKTPLIAALERAINDNRPLSFSRIQLEEFPEKGRLVDLTVKPLVIGDSDTPAHALILIDDKKYRDSQHDDVETVPAYASDAQTRERLTDLEQELERTREALQSTIEEIETANEELQASNEQLMSANEELQSTNEELSSVNEELYSVNAEYHRQNDDLTKLTSDFDMLLNATNIGVIFLDKQGKISRFTSLAGGLFNLGDADINRPLSNFRSPFADIDPEKLRQDSVKEREVIELEAKHEKGSTWLARAVTNKNNTGSVMAFIDISELREAETQARHNKKMLEVIQKTTRAFYLELDGAMETLLVQLGFDDYIGIENLELPFKLSAANIHPDDRDDYNAKREEMSRQDSGEIVCRVWNAEDNRHRYIRIVGNRTKSNIWNIAAYDVDNVVRGQKELAEQKSILDATLDASQSFKAFIRPDQTYQFVNNAYRKQFDLGDVDVVGKSVADILPEDLYFQISNKIKEVNIVGNVQFIIETVVNNRNLLLSVHYKSVYDQENTLLGFVVDGIDIANIVKYGEKLEEVDKVIGTATRQSFQALLIVDIKSGLIDFANNAAMQRLGINDEHFLPNNIKISRITPEWGDQNWQRFFESCAPCEARLENDIVVFNGSSATGTADMYVETLVRDDNKRKAIIRIFENAEKIQLLENLRQRSQQLATSNRDLEQFTSVVAHDLRTPLRHISQFAQILEDSGGKMTKSDMIEHTKIMGTSAKNLNEMVSGLLDYSRIGRARPAFTACDLSVCVDQATELLASDISETGAKIIVDSLPIIDGDAGLLTRLFQNIISNSIKYRKENVRPVITICADKHNPDMFSISDNGIGIETGFEEKIFQLFHRLHGDEKYPGLGLGLATCRRIAEIHNLSLICDTKVETGSCFILSPL